MSVDAEEDPFQGVGRVFDTRGEESTASGHRDAFRGSCVSRGDCQNRSDLHRSGRTFVRGPSVRRSGREDDEPLTDSCTLIENHFTFSVPTTRLPTRALPIARVGK